MYISLLNCIPFRFFPLLLLSIYLSLPLSLNNYSRFAFVYSYVLHFFSCIYIVSHFLACIPFSVFDFLSSVFILPLSVCPSFSFPFPSPTLSVSVYLCCFLSRSLLISLLSPPLSFCLSLSLPLLACVSLFMFACFLLVLSSLSLFLCLCLC